MAEEVTKLGGIYLYSVLTEEEVEAWVSSEGDPKLPNESITAAFRQAERLFAEEQDGGEGGDSLEINYRDIAIPRLSEILSELVWRVVGGELSVDLAISYLASDKPFASRLRAKEEESGDGAGKEGDAKKEVGEEKEGGEKAGTEDAAEPLPLQEALCDTVWGVDVMVRGTVEVLTLEKLTPLQQEQWGRLCSFVQRLHADELVPQRLLLVLLSDEVLVGSKMVVAPTTVKGGKQNTPLARSMLKKGTEMVYKQHRFNLQREETEGFAKLLVLLAGVRDGGNRRGNAGTDSEENMRRLIGYFDLDPNRALDLTLDALESDPANRGLLRLVGRFNKDSVAPVLGFKLAHYRNPSVAKYHRAAMRSAFKNKEIDAARYKVQIDKVTPRSLYVLIAVLLTTGTLSMDELLRHVSPGIATLATKEKEYLADLETKIAKAGNKVPKLDADGNMDSAAASASSDNAMSKLGSMGPLAMGGGGGYGGGMMGGGMGSGTLYGGRDRDGRNGGMGGGHGGSSARDRDGRRDGRDSRDNGRRQSGDNSAGVKANGSTAAVAGGAGDGGVDDDSVTPGLDNQLYGVLEALLDLRAWTLASGLLARLTKQGIDPLRDYGVREALKRLVKDSMDGLASRYPKPITLYPAGTKRGPTNTTTAAAGVPSSPVPSLSVSVSGMASDAEEAEAGEVTLPVTSKTAVSRSTMANGMTLPPTLKSPPASNLKDLKDLQRLPGYGAGFVKPETLSEAVGVLAPLLKIVGPYLGRDPTMFARVCRVLAAVSSRNPLNIVVKTSTSRRSSSSSSSSTSAAAKVAAAKASAVAATAAASSGGGQGNKAKANGGSTGSTTTTTNPAAVAAAAAAAAKDPLGAKDAAAKDPLKAFHSLFGLSPAEARELHRRGEAEGGAGAGEAALKKELDRRKAAYVRVALTVAPSLGMTHANPGMQQEVWNMLAELPYVDRFMLYGAWRGHGMEKYALGVKHPQYAVAEIAAGAEISRLIKMLTSDNVKDMARKLGKSSHSHPLLFAEKALNQLESYDNFISMVADSMKFVGKTLGLDCMAYTMVQHLCQSNRSFVSDSGLDLERWVTNLSTFAGLLHRKNPEADSKPLLSWAVRSLGEGGEPAMAAGKVLREVLHKAGGVQVLDGWSITQAQVDGKGGGDILRQENASFGSTVKPIKRAKVVLQEATEKAGASLPLLVLPALQAGSLLYEGGSLDDQMRGKPQPHLKVLGHRADETHTTLLQAMEFVCSKAWIKSKCPTIKTLLTTYGLDPRVVFHIWRPVINENLIKCWFPKAGTKTEREQRDEAIAKRFIGELEASMTELSIVPESSPLTSKLILIFWALSLPDVYIPTKKYAQVVTNMHEAKRRADSKLQQAAEEDVAMSKAERSRYMLDRKTSPTVAAKLEAEKTSQSAHVKRVKNKLREIKASLFAAKDKHKTGAETIDAVLKHLVAPRMGMGPEEAYFCSKFFNTLHAIEAPNFNSLVFYSRSFEGLSSTLLCKTQYEAAGLGFFLKDLLENVKEWRKTKNEAIYKMEAGTKHGFKLGDTSQSIVEGKAPQLNHAAFVKISGEWSMQVTKAVMAAVASDEFLLIKCGLIMYNKLIETFPMSLKERKLLCLKLQPRTDKAIEPRDDIRVPCTRIVNQLNKQISESPPDPVAPGQRPATASAKTASAGGSGATSGKIAPVSTTTTSGKSTAGGGSQTSRGKSATAPGSAAADGKASALSATAKPYVPAPAASGRGGSSSASSAATKQSGSQAGKRQQTNSGPVGGGQVVKKEPASSASSAAAATTVTASGVAKRAREGGESARLKPAKTARVAVAVAVAVGEQELGEIVSEKKAAAASSSSAGGGEGKHALATPRDSKPLRKAATASSSSEAASKAGGSSKPSTTSSTSKPSSAASGAPAAGAAAATGASSRQSSTGARATGGRESSGRKVDSKVASSSGSGSTTTGSSRGGRVVRISSSTGGGGGGGSSSSNGVDSKDAGRRSRGQGQGEGDRERRDKSGRTSDADSRAKALASQDMGAEGPAAPRDSGSGSGTLSVRRSRESRGAGESRGGGGGGGGAVVGSMSRTNSNSRLANGRGSGGAQQSEHDRPGGRETTSRHGGGGDAGGVRFEGPARAGGGQRTTAESSRSGGGAGSRGSKRGRSAEPERSGGRDGGGYDGPGSAEGDPSQAFDSKRMRQPDQAMMPQPEGVGGRRGSAKSSVDRWGRGYGGGGGGSGGGTWEREGPAAPNEANNSSGRYHDDLRHGGGGGGGRMQMPSHEVPDRPAAYEARGRGRGGRSGAVMDDGQDRGGSGGGGGGGGSGHRDARGGGGGREHPSDEDIRSRSSRDSKNSKKSRGDRQRGDSNRDGDGGGGSGSGRKDKKKTSKSKKRKH